MSTEILGKDHETLPEHVAFGLRDGATHAIDGYVADASDRIDDAIVERLEDDTEIDSADVKLVEALATEIVVDEVAARTAKALDSDDAVDIVAIERELRRQQIREREHRKRRLGQPVLTWTNTGRPYQPRR